jgi:katanin p80 WD40 repeat-containing subunit B1
MKQKSQKISSFLGHNSKTNCLKIGPKSGRVLATGGQDRNVNLWAIGRPTALLVILN